MNSGPMRSCCWTVTGVMGMIYTSKPENWKRNGWSSLRWLCEWFHIKDFPDHIYLRWWAAVFPSPGLINLISNVPWWLQVQLVSRQLHGKQSRLPDALLWGNDLLQGLFHAVKVPLLSRLVQLFIEPATESLHLPPPGGFFSRAIAARAVKWQHIKSV